MATTPTFTIEPTNNPASIYYLHPFDVGHKVITNIFNGSGYSDWRRAVILALSAKNKLTFVDGRTTKPAKDSSDLSAWGRVNDVIIGWLLSSLEPSIAKSVQWHKTAKEFWDELHERVGNGSNYMWLLSYLTHVLSGSVKCKVPVLPHYKSIGCYSRRSIKSIFHSKLWKLPDDTYVSARSFIGHMCYMSIYHNSLTTNGSLSSSTHRQNGVSTSSSPTASFPLSQSQTVVVENPMSLDRSGKLVCNVVVGVTQEKV